MSSGAFDFRRTSGTHPCAGDLYAVCRGLGGPLGAVWGAFAARPGTVRP